MDTKSKLFAIAVAVTSLAMAPSLFNINSASAVTWCEQQVKGSDLIEYCKRGWYDHDHCNKYAPQADSKEEGAAYKKGWDHGSCK
jgi:hypothetical protein